MVFDVPAESGGALTILKQYHDTAVKDAENEWIFVISTPQLIEKSNVKILSYRWIKKSWMHRVFFDRFIAHNLVRKYSVDEVISLQNIVVPNVKVKQTLYLHQPLPFVDKKYKITENQDSDGILLSATTANSIYSYFIGGVRYIDDISASTTYFTFNREISDIDYCNYPYYKDESKQNIIAKPKIINDINVERQAPAIMDSFYRIKDINILNDVNYYGGGSYFNVIINA